MTEGVRDTDETGLRPPEVQTRYWEWKAGGTLSKLRDHPGHCLGRQADVEAKSQVGNLGVQIRGPEVMSQLGEEPGTKRVCTSTRTC